MFYRHREGSSEVQCCSAANTREQLEEEEGAERDSGSFAVRCDTQSQIWASGNFIQDCCCISICVNLRWHLNVNRFHEMCVCMCVCIVATLIFTKMFPTLTNTIVKTDWITGSQQILHILINVTHHTSSTLYVNVWPIVYCAIVKVF